MTSRTYSAELPSSRSVMASRSRSGARRSYAHWDRERGVALEGSEPGRERLLTYGVDLIRDQLEPTKRRVRAVLGERVSDYDGRSGMTVGIPARSRKRVHDRRVRKSLADLRHPAVDIELIHEVLEGRP